MATFNRESIQVPSVENDVNLDVWLYKPAGPGPYPVVVAGHGYVSPLCRGLGDDVLNIVAASP